MNNALYIGTMSGTSVDGLDIVIVDIHDNGTVQLLHSYFATYPESLRLDIRKLQTLTSAVLFNQQQEKLDHIDKALSEFYAVHINKCLAEANIPAENIKAIGNHGQTILHQPNSKPAFSLQICNPQNLANKCCIPVIANFRQADIEQGGQGAPLMPAFHATVFKKYSPCAIINIGGISNTTFLLNDDNANDDHNSHVIGFDNGPGNTLMDAWIYKHQKKSYDRNGEWAKSGKTHDSLLEKLLNHFFFSQPAPKSTGQDIFNLQWLEGLLSEFPALAPNDVQATLCDLTASCIANDVSNIDTIELQHIFICGGGVNNSFLLERLKFFLRKNILIQSTASVGIDPNWLEALGFAWLASCHTNKFSGNLPSVTGAKNAVVLGQRFDPKQNHSLG